MSTSIEKVETGSRATLLTGLRGVAKRSRPSWGARDGIGDGVRRYQARQSVQSVLTTKSPVSVPGLCSPTLFCT